LPLRSDRSIRSLRVRLRLPRLRNLSHEQKIREQRAESLLYYQLSAQVRSRPRIACTARVKCSRSCLSLAIVAELIAVRRHAERALLSL
jgi:hypothetical protein